MATDKQRVRERLRVWAGTGITSVRLYPAGRTLDERLSTLGRAIQLCAETPSVPDRAGPAPGRGSRSGTSDR